MSAVIAALGAVIGYLGGDVAQKSTFERLLWPQRFHNHLDVATGVKLALLHPMSGPLQSAALATLDDFRDNGLYRGFLRGDMLGTAFYGEHRDVRYFHRTAATPEQQRTADSVRNGFWYQVLKEVERRHVLRPVASGGSGDDVEKTAAETTTDITVPSRSVKLLFRLRLSVLDNEPAPPGANDVVETDLTKWTFLSIVTSELSTICVAVATGLWAFLGRNASNGPDAWLVGYFLLPVVLRLLAAISSVRREDVFAGGEAIPTLWTERTDPQYKEVFEIYDSAVGFILGLSAPPATTAMTQFFVHYGHPIRHTVIDRVRETLSIAIVYIFVLYFPVGLFALSWMKTRSQYIWLGQQFYCILAMHILRILGWEGCSRTEEKVAKILYKDRCACLKGRNARVEARLTIDHVLSSPHTFKLADDYWPLRLLHIPTRTSVRRHSAHDYRDPTGKVHQRPQYSILSYTWGRFKVDGGETLAVEGVDWQIPAINPEHFTAAAFQRVIDERLGSDAIEWAWIDVACIDQRPGNPDMAIEIGNQASIFNKAAHAFVWLTSIVGGRETAIKDIVSFGVELRNFIDHGKTDNGLSLLDVVARLRTAFDTVFEDPWFSSLWTLQEIVMRKDAMAISLAAEKLTWDGTDAMHFFMFVNTAQNVWQDVLALIDRAGRLRYADAYAYKPSSPVHEHVSRIQQWLLSTGFYYLDTDNPNVQYGTAKYRNTEHDEDRIYAIMQLYSLRVGKAAQPDLAPELYPGFAQLELEFADAINQCCPMLGQMFTHTACDVPRHTWCITRDSTVPDSLMDYRDPRPLGRISLVESGTAVAHGRCCLLADLNELLTSPGRRDLSSTSAQLHLDEYMRKALDPSPALAWHIRWDNTVLMPKLLRRYGRENLVLLHLGSLRWPECGKEERRRQVALLLSPVHPTTPNAVIGKTYFRYGLYTWIEYTTSMTDQVSRLAWETMSLPVT
ncbi:hypothetical protein CMQ_7047 [Grosmannia clavigera kw1407]|uniref:Heterokaryon incompatibility domain-containing protein n=1 Tax=Grosmannia clavigera (strain kw1407 / UAMH 11150) TaxID=655863 RepID=F0XPU2_GROCL|nr:uncharacterized protein CMQ_7047 [Grosmannia clavigera kw1407]EFX00045.1 hypothetical protein CMQ_7047 [Grosmannia clavigera kw1407]